MLGASGIDKMIGPIAKREALRHQGQNQIDFQIVLGKLRPF
jgi:hypothetical protein